VANGLLVVISFMGRGHKISITGALAECSIRFSLEKSQDFYLLDQIFQMDCIEAEN
jgi:hypothetical protein